MNYEIRRSVRRTMSIEIKHGTDLIVHAPYGVNEADIRKFVIREKNWIEKHMGKVDLMNREWTESQIHSMKERAESLIPELVKKYSDLTGLVPSSVRIGSAKTRFGSCSSKDSLNFSLYLMAYPDEAIEYVVMHEIAHIKYKDHKKHFYALISVYMPDYKKRNSLLRQRKNI